MGRARRGTCVIAFHPQRVKATALAADVGTGFPSLHTDVQLSHKVINVNTFLMSGNCTVLLNSFGILVIKNCVLEFPGAAVGQGSGFVTAVAPEAGGSLAPERLHAVGVAKELCSARCPCWMCSGEGQGHISEETVRQGQSDLTLATVPGKEDTPGGQAWQRAICFRICAPGTSLGFSASPLIQTKWARIYFLFTPSSFHTKERNTIPTGSCVLPEVLRFVPFPSLSSLKTGGEIYYPGNNENNGSHLFGLLFFVILMFFFPGGHFFFFAEGRYSLLLSHGFSQGSKNLLFSEEEEEGLYKAFKGSINTESDKFNLTVCCGGFR